MAKSGVYDYSTTAGSNLDIDGTDISGATGKVKDGDNAIRSKMAHDVAFAKDLGGAATTAGSANVQTVTLTQTVTAYVTGLRFTVKFGISNTSTTVTLNPNSLGAKSVKVAFGGVLADPIPGDMMLGNYGEFLYDGTYLVLINGQTQSRYPPGTLYGLTLTNNSGTPNDKIDMAVGSARDAADSANMDWTAALTAKDITTAWAVGSSAGLLDTGAVGNSTYYLWGIKRPDTGVADLLGSLSRTAPTMPTNYTIKVLLGYFIRTGGVNGTPVWFGTSGPIGEFVSSLIVGGSAVSLTNNTTANVTSISLTAGDWTISGSVAFVAGASTTVGYLAGAGTTTSATLPSVPDCSLILGFSVTQLTDVSFPIPTVRLVLTATTTVYLVARAGFSVSTMAAYGRLSARRTR